MIDATDRLSPDDKVLIETMTTALRHRSPDGEGYYFDRNAELGHSRLAIVDLTGGAQPLFNEDRSNGLTRWPAANEKREPQVDATHRPYLEAALTTGPQLRMPHRR